MEKLSLRVFGVIGILVFFPLFLLTFVDVHLIEKSGKAFIEWKLQNEVNQKIDSIQLPDFAPKSGPLEKLLGDKFRQAQEQTEAKLADLKQQLKNDAPALLAAELAKLRNLDCECRKKWEQSILRSMQLEIASLESLKMKIADYSHAKYMEIVTNLTLDVRIFLGTNSIVFMLFLLASFVQPRAIKHLFLPCGLMLISTLICSYFYLFEQNWFYSILYNNYTGFGYVAYLGIVFAILCDIVFNHARITTEVINSFLSAIGQIGSSLSPC